MQPCKEPFNLPPTPISPQLPAILPWSALSTGSVGGDKFYPFFILQCLIKGITIICFITNDVWWPLLNERSLYCCSYQRYFVGGSTFHNCGDRKTRSVCDCHDFGAFAALCRANSSAPFFAGVNVPSMNVSRTSIFPRS